MTPDLGNWILPIALLCGVFGVFFAQSLFEMALVLGTSFVGAALVASASGLGPPRETWLGLGLFVVGLIAQSGGGKSRRRDED